MKSKKTVLSGLLCAAILLCAGPGAMAQHGATLAPTRIAGEFEAFAGSEANAQSLVTGLRNGTPVMLAAPSSGNAVTTLTVDPPTRPMGYGNVYISLALARQQLANHGIIDPTPQEIQAALTGGTIVTGSGAETQTVTLKGILTQRADGAGWGVIARSQGMNLGHVVSGLKGTNAGIAAGAAAGSSAGITTATGTGVQVRGNSAQAPGHNRSIVTGSGIVTATGARAGPVTGANAKAGNAGIVTGSGTAAAARGGAATQGQAKALSRP